MGITHALVSAKSDGGDATKVRPSNWNADHVLSGVGFGNCRQTIISGPVNTSGHSAFGGSTGSGTVTTSGTIVAAAANGAGAGGAIDRIGLKSNASWTGLTTNGTMYLYVTVNADGTLTEGSTTVAPVYQFGGTPAVTSNLFTFNISEMAGYLGNGATAPQAYRVYVGEVTVAGNVVTAITWYALNGRYTSAWTATLPAASSGTTFTHNLGTNERIHSIFEAECTTVDGTFEVGDRMTGLYTNSNSTAAPPMFVNNLLTSTIAAGGISGITGAIPEGGGNMVTLTAASWKYRAHISRGW